MVLQYEQCVCRAFAMCVLPHPTVGWKIANARGTVTRQSASASGNPPPQEDTTTTQTLDSITPRIREERAAQDLEGEAGQEAAFNPETGEINWDCPCLGGMAHGPCGEEFKAAFSCFVYSSEEPKGMDCIDKFKCVPPLHMDMVLRCFEIRRLTDVNRGMQDCFRLHPDVYGSELDDDDEDEGAPVPAEASESPPAAADIDAASNPDEKRSRAKEVKTQMRASADSQGEQPESDELLPKAWHDTEEQNRDRATGTSAEK